jgi:hypothetical protein
MYQLIRSPLRPRAVVPFITGGYTTGSPRDGVNLSGGNIGGGLTWLFRDRLGLRVEARDYLFRGDAICLDSG